MPAYTGFQDLIHYHAAEPDSQSLLRGDGPFWAWTHDGHVIESFELTTVPRDRPLVNMYYMLITNQEIQQGLFLTIKK